MYINDETNSEEFVNRIMTKPIYFKILNFDMKNIETSIYLYYFYLINVFNDYDEIYDYDFVVGDDNYLISYVTKIDEEYYDVLTVKYRYLNNDDTSMFYDRKVVKIIKYDKYLKQCIKIRTNIHVNCLRYASKIFMYISFDNLSAKINEYFTWHDFNTGVVYRIAVNSKGRGDYYLASERGFF